MRQLRWVLLGLCALAATAQTVPVANPSFEDGTQTPDGWTLSGGEGRWLDTGADGHKAIAVTGDGRDTNYWRSAPLALEPSQIYRLSFQAKNLGASSGTAITGPVLANCDIGKPGDEWTAFRSVFVTPEKVNPNDTWLRFGQWHLSGEVAFDQIALTEVAPVYAKDGELELGAGETLDGRDYTCTMSVGGDVRNHSRALVRHQCGFNTYRWVFGAGSEVVYRHQLAGRQQTVASVNVGVTWYAGGRLLVQASNDGQAWTDLGIIDTLGSGEFDLPTGLLPAEAVWIRLSAQAKQRVGADSDPGAFQVSQYSYHALVDGAPVTLKGSTQYLAVQAADPRVEVRVVGLGEGLPGGDNHVRLALKPTGAAVKLRPAVELSQDGKSAAKDSVEVNVPAGGTTVDVPYRVPGTGTFELAVTLGPGSPYRAETSLFVNDLFNTTYGAVVPQSNAQVGLWTCESGWKVSQTRPLPTARAKGVTVRAAANEADVAQLVVRPERELKQFIATGSALAGPGGKLIPAAQVEVLRVRYVPVTVPTDRTSIAAPWPDPLPPFNGMIDLAAGQNQPLWVRVKVPKGTAAGDYTGQVQLRANGYQTDVPLTVHVYGFELPDRMTCTTAFGFSPGTVFRYQNVTDAEQRREVLAKYLQDYSDHHISWYDPAPLDHFKYDWPSLGSWTGGLRDREVKHAGQGSLKIADENPKAGYSAHYDEPLTIPKSGLKLAFWYKTAEPGHRFIVTFNHDDADHQWMSGRNNDMQVTGNGEWQHFEREVKKFADDAKYVRLSLWPCLYAEDGSTLGTVWFDDVSVVDLDTGQELLTGGDMEPLSLDALKPIFDWTAWDQAMTKAINEYHFNSFRLPVPGLGGGTFHSRTEPSLLGYPADSIEYQTALGAWLHEVQEHLRLKGWLDEAYVYWFDEPDPKDYAFVMNGFRKLKEYAPDLTRMLTEQVEPDLVGGPNLWCPVSPNFALDQANERRKAGDHFWWYVCTGPKAPYCTLFIDHPGTELRVWLQQTWQRGIEGILVWQSNYWWSHTAYPDSPQNPYLDPMGWVSGYDTPQGTKRPWGNGDGRFIYPPEAAADAAPAQPVLDGPVDSIRFEMLRDGIEDYEYYVILRDLLQQHGSKVTPAERVAMTKLLDVPESITRDTTTFTTDPAPIEQHRDAVAKAIERLSR